MSAYAVWLFHSNGKNASILLNFPHYSLLLMLLIATTHNVAMSFRYLVILQSLGLKTKVLSWFRIFLLGQILNTFVGQSGNVYRTLALKRQYGFNYTNTIATYAAFAWMDTLLGAFLALLVIVLWDSSFELGGVNVLAIIGILLLSLLAAPLLFKGMSRIFVSWVEHQNSWLAKLIRLSSNALKVTTNPSLLATTSVVGLVTFALNTIMIDLAFRGLEISLTLPALVLFVFLYRLSGLVIITPDNLGVRELAYGFLSQAIGLEMCDGLIVSGIIRLVSYVTLAFLGLFMALYRDRQKEKGKIAPASESV